MARVIINNSRFNPLSFKEMLEPMALYGQEYRAQEDALNEVALDAGLIGGMINENTDPIAYNTYNNFMTDLENRVDQLNKEGLSLNSRKNMLQMRTRRANEIKPIEVAFARRKELADEQRKALAADPTLRYQRYARDMSLDSLIQDPSIDYGSSYSGALLTKQVSDMVSNLRRTVDKKTLKSLGLPFQYEMEINKGVNPSDVMTAMFRDAQDGDPAAVKFLNGMVNKVLDASKVRSWSDDDTYREFVDFAKMGLPSAIEAPEYRYFTDNFNLQSTLDSNKKPKEEGKEDASYKYTLRPIQYLKTSGDEAKHFKNIQSLTVEDGIKASYFGKHGNINALKVHDEIKEETKKALSEYHKTHPRGDVNPWALKDSTNERKIREETKKKVLDKYGVKEAISDEQYETLTALGYDGNTPITKASQLYDPLNKLSEARTAYSTNLNDYNYADNVIRNNLGNWNSNDTYSGTVYKLNPDGTQGKAVKYKSLNLYDGKDNKKNRITDIAYSAFTPEFIIVQVGEEGDQYLMTPDVLGGTAYNLINEANQFIKNDPDVDLTEVSKAITISLTKLLHSYNQGISNTNSKIRE